MKRVFIIYLGSRGGGAVDTLGIVSALSRVGNHHYSLMISENNALLSSFNKLCLNNLFVVKTFKRSFFGFLLSTLFFVNILKIVRIIQKEKPDILFFTMSHPWNPIIAKLSKMILKNIKIVHIVHNPIGFEAVGSGLFNYVINKLEKVMIELSDSIITLSKNTGDYLLRNYKLAEEKVKIFRLGSNTSLFANTFNHKGFLSNSKMRLLFFGRILRYKGLDVLIDAYDLMLNEGMNISLTVAGEGKIDAELLVKMEKLGVKIINRWIGEEEMIRLFEESDVLIAPYKQASQSGPVSIATALGIPVIATRVGGLMEQVIDGVNGFLVEPNNPEAIKEAVKKLLNNAELLSNMSEGAKRLSRDYFSWDVIVREIEKIWT